jgi:hypothetical protein
MDKRAKSDYAYTVHGNVIAIVDLNLGNLSVAQDTANVLEAIKRNLGNTLSGYAVIYKDSFGNRDGVRLTEEGEIDFYALRERDMNKALKHLFHLFP